MLALASFSTRIPPEELIRAGQPSSSIQRTMSSMWMHMSPMMPLPYSMNARHPRGWTIALYGRIGAGPVHISQSRCSGGVASGGLVRFLM